jgi:Zn-dependent protease
VKAHVTLFRIPIHFHFSYLFLILIFGYLFVARDREQGLTLFFVWIPIVTVAILLHELGHALTGRAFGLSPFIFLHGMGGATQFDPQKLRALSFLRKLAITLAGPFAGMAIGVALHAFHVLTPWKLPPLAHEAIDIAVLTTLIWGVLNLAPMLPLDGGHVVALVLERIVGPKGYVYARVASIGVAIALAVPLIFYEQYFSFFMMLSLALMNWRDYRTAKNWMKDEPLLAMIKEAHAALEAGDTAKVRRLAEAVRDGAETDVSKGHAAHLLAWAHLMEGDAARARTALEASPSRPDAFLEGSVYLACGDPSRALLPLCEALVDRGDDEVADAVAEAAITSGRIDEILALVADEERAKKIGVYPLQRIGQRLFRRGRYGLSSDLHTKVFERFADPVDAFNAACGAVRAGRRERSLDLLERAVKAGLPDRSLLEDEDLAPLREEPRFQALL